MIYTLIVGGEVGGKQHVALVDCGFAKSDWLKRYAFSNWEEPKDVLAKVGFAPEDVEVILITHMHFDHMGNFQAFPNAKLYIQLDEYLGWSEAVCCAHQQMQTEEERAWIFSSFDPEDLVRAAQGIATGRVYFVRGKRKFFRELPLTSRKIRTPSALNFSWFGRTTGHSPSPATPYIGIPTSRKCGQPVTTRETRLIRSTPFCKCATR